MENFELFTTADKATLTTDLRLFLRDLSEADVEADTSVSAEAVDGFRSLVSSVSESIALEAKDFVDLLL